MSWCPFAILTTKLPGGRVHRRYLARLRVAEGTTPYRWSLRRGHLPRGLRLSASGIISGRPSKPGRYAFTVRVRDSARHHLTLSEKFVIVIRRR